MKLFLSATPARRLGLLLLTLLVALLIISNTAEARAAAQPAIAQTVTAAAGLVLLPA
ncbi:hypothetical protein [Hymenobacter saemangeumensis]|uniref:hypothetical protein n=1 Tax=Hymenobacter saemangeumensis TaxID=1084522 RepID=UPI0031E5F963